MLFTRRLALVAALFATSASAQQFVAGEIVIDHPWARATPKGASVGAGYMNVRNNGRAAGRDRQRGNRVHPHDAAFHFRFMHLNRASGVLSLIHI